MRRIWVRETAGWASLGLHVRILAERVGCPQWKKEKEREACSSLVTASLSEQPLHGMLRYHPISRTGEEEEGGFSSRRCAWGAVCWGGIGLQTYKWMPQAPLPNPADLAPPHLSRPCIPFCQQLICSATLPYLSPLFSLSVSPSPLVVSALGRFTLGLITAHRCIRAPNKGSLALLSATFYQAWWVSCWPSRYYAAAVEHRSHCAPKWPSRTQTHLTWIHWFTLFKWWIDFSSVAGERKTPTMQ